MKQSQDPTPNLSMGGGVDSILKKKKNQLIIVAREDRREMDRMVLHNEELAAGIKEIKDEEE